MSEDGELSDSSPPANNKDDDNDDGFVIDRSFSMTVVEDSEGTTTSTSEDVNVVVEASGDSEDVKKDTEASGATSEWQKQMRRRLLEEVDPTEGPQTKRRRVNLCFNCRGEHSITQCQEPKDFAAIRKNKQEFLAQNSKNSQGGRISKVTEEKESKFKPGRLSQNLREALNLGPDDIPEWIYRMRRMGFYEGYPPGHLRKSLKHEYEKLKIFTADSESQSPSEDVDDDIRPSPKVQGEAIHFYMGFNKTYKALNDLDECRFEVPPWNTFCDMLQEQVSRNHEINEKHRIRDARDRRAELRKARRRQEEEQKASGSEEVVTTSVKDSEGPTSSEDRRERTPEPKEGGEDVQERLGESIHQLIGTPILSRRDASGTWIAPTTPTLEQFAVGIVPFEAKEEEKPRGIFKKIMGIFKGKGKDGDDGK